MLKFWKKIVWVVLGAQKKIYILNIFWLKIYQGLKSGNVGDKGADTEATGEEINQYQEGTKIKMPPITQNQPLSKALIFFSKFKKNFLL